MPFTHELDQMIHCRNQIIFFHVERYVTQSISAKYEESCIHGLKQRKLSKLMKSLETVCRIFSNCAVSAFPMHFLNSPNFECKQIIDSSIRTKGATV